MPAAKYAVSFSLPPTGSAKLSTENHWVADAYNSLEKSFIAQFQLYFPDKLAPKTVVVIPSLTLDQQILEKIEGVNFYEERMLCMLLLLRMPNTHVVFLSSMPIDPAIVDYYLHLLPGITGYHARQRLTLLSCFDASAKSLTQKILDRPRLIRRIRENIREPQAAHLSCFNVTDAERQLAVALQIPVYGCNPSLENLGNKSNSRKLFRTCGLPTPNGYEDLYSEEEMIDALYKLKSENPAIQKAVIKTNEGFSGEGNAIFSYSQSPLHGLRKWITQQLPSRLKIVANDLDYPHFLAKFQDNGGVVEAFVEGQEKQSPSVQCRINPLGEIDIISTHDQLLGGESGQVYLGATFPANKAYARELAEMGRRIAEELRHYGVLGRFGVDFISVKVPEGWTHYAIEINLRKGGTTHPYLMLQFLTCGTYNVDLAHFMTANCQQRYYQCTDNLKHQGLKGLTPHDLIEIAMQNELLYDSTLQEGVIFHLISALSQYGKLGMVCIGSSPKRASFFYQKTKDVLLAECSKTPGN